MTARNGPAVPAALPDEVLRAIDARVAERIAPLEKEVAKLKARVPDERVTSTGAAKLLGCSVATIKRRLKLKNGDFPPPEWMGQIMRWRVDVLEGWLAKQSAAPRPHRLHGVARWTREQHAERERRKAKARRGER